MGDVVAAVDRYQDIPPEVRATLKARIAKRQYDEFATIKRDTIVGAYRYENLRDMHFGKGTICRTVTRDKWSDTTQERGLVYCEQDHCLIVPTVCRNVSRVTRVPMQKADAATDGMMGPPEGTTFAVASVKGGVDTDAGELSFEAPAAGAKPSFAAVASGSSPVLPGGSDAGLSGGSDGGSGPGSSFAGIGGLPLLTPAGFSAIPGIPTSAGPSGLPGVPGVPGVGVPVTPVPEPETYALLGLGLGLVAWVARRRRSAATSIQHH